MNDGRRRTLVALGTGWFAGAKAWGQPGVRPLRLGWLGTTAPQAEPYNRAFLQRLAELGFVEGRNLQIDHRRVQGPGPQLTQTAGELGRSACDVYFAPGTEWTLGAMVQASRDKPIAFVATDYDPVATGHVAALARPGGRVTGVSMLQTELPAKRLQVLKELLPKVRRVAALSDVASAGQLAVTRAAAAQLNLQLVVHEYERPPYDFAVAFETFAKAKAEALVAMGSAFFVPGRQRIPELALQHRLPSVFHNVLWAENGGLMSYGPNFSVSYRRAAEMVVKLFNGANPAEMPIEQPSGVEMVVNLRSAKALNLVIPSALLARADRLID